MSQGPSRKSHGCHHRVPKSTAPRFDGVLRGLSYIVLLVANMFYGKRTQSEIGPGNRGAWSEVRRKPGASCEGPLPARSHGTHLIPPSRGCETSLREVRPSLSVRGLCERPVTRAPPAQHVPRLPREAGVELVQTVQPQGRPSRPSPSSPMPAKARPREQNLPRAACVHALLHAGARMSRTHAQLPV